MNYEIKSLTSIRGIAAFYVMVFHFLRVSNPEEFSDIRRYIFRAVNKGYLSVDLFFFLSAFLLSLVYSSKFKNNVIISDYKNFIISRFARIYPLYFVFCFIYYFIYNKEFYTIPLNLSLFQVLTDMPNYMVDVFWSLSTEWILYLFFPFIFLLLNKIESKWIHIFIIFFAPFLIYLLKDMNYWVITSNGLKNLGYNSIGMAVGFVALIRCTLGFIIGISLYFVLQKINTINQKRYFKPIYLILFIPFFFINNSQYFILIFFVLLIMTCYLNDDLLSLLNSKIIYTIGLWSYSIYLAHRFCYWIVQNLLDIENRTLLAFLAIITALIISYITYNLVEVKSKKILLRILKK